MSNIFWCGSILNHDGLKRYKGETPAATQWTRGLIDGILENGTEVQIFASVWDALYPKGKILPGNYKFLDSKYDQTLVRYLNFPLLRTDSVAISLRIQIEKAIKSGNKPTAILNYNTYPYYCKAIKKIKKLYPDILWVNVVLDLDDPLKDNWHKFLNDTEGSDASVFLSYWGFDNAPISSKFHLDSGWTGDLPEMTKLDNKTIIYAGKLYDYGGIQNIIDAIKLVPNSDVNFEFYGKGNHAALNQLALKDTRVKIKGFVSDDVLHEACCKATAFLSPRDVNFQGTRMIFPSKILFYLKYRKPIISEMLPGFSLDYGELLIQPKGDTSTDWADAIQKTINLDEIFLLNMQNKIHKFLMNKTWNIQASNLLTYINNLK